jgi:AcrR family transcriptional regulator
MSVIEQIGGRGAFSRARKTENRQRLIEAAGQVFERMGYSPASVDDIARAAGVSRQTFYRHFEGKVSVGLALYQELRENAVAVWQDIGADDAHDLEKVRRWLGRMFAVSGTQGAAIRTFFEMGIVEPAFFQLSKSVVQELISLLAERIPAFAGCGKTSPEELRHQVEAWLLVFQIVDHSSNAAVGFLEVDLECLIDVLATDFVAFVERHTPCERVVSLRTKN